MKHPVFYLVMLISTLMVSSCETTSEPDFVQWKDWIALKSGADGIGDIRRNALETVINEQINAILNDSITENEKTERLISATCYYATFKYCDPLNSDGDIIKYDDSWYQFDASDVKYRVCDEIMETFNLDIPQDEYIYYVNVNENSLKEQAEGVYNDYCYEYRNFLRESVDVYAWEEDKERSDRKSGVAVYDVIYVVSIGNETIYVKCQCMENDVTGRSEIKIENKSEYLLDL